MTTSPRLVYTPRPRHLWFPVGTEVTFRGFPGQGQFGINSPQPIEDCDGYTPWLPEPYVYVDATDGSATSVPAADLSVVAS